MESNKSCYSGRFRGYRNNARKFAGKTLFGNRKYMTLQFFCQKYISIWLCKFDISFNLTVINLLNKHDDVTSAHTL